MGDFWSWIIDLAFSVGGHAGIFIISVLGNLIPFAPIPYLALVFFYSAYMPDSSPLTVGLVSGIGGGVGKLIIYMMGMGASKLLSSERSKQLEAFKRLVGDYGALAAFIFAATPSPDDIVVGVLGITRYSLVKFFVAITSGKILISLATAYFGKIFSFILTGENLIVGTIVTVAVFILLTWFILSVDWIKVFEIVKTHGWREFFILLRKRGIKEFMFRKDRG